MSIENIDFDPVFDELKKRVKAAEESKSWLDYRDTWRFIEGVTLLMGQDSPVMQRDLEQLRDEMKKRAEDATKDYFKIV